MMIDRKKMSIKKVFLCPFIPMTAIALNVLISETGKQTIGLSGIFISFIGASLYNYVPFLVLGLMMYFLLWMCKANMIAFIVVGSIVATIGVLLFEISEPLKIIKIVIVGGITGFFYASKLRSSDPN